MKQTIIFLLLLLLLLLLRFFIACSPATRCETKTEIHQKITAKNLSLNCTTVQPYLLKKVRVPTIAATSYLIALRQNFKKQTVSVNEPLLAYIIKDKSTTITALSYLTAING